MRFSGDTFDSYNTTIARHITHKGKSAVILNVTHYSSSTSRHQGEVRWAIQNHIETVFRVDQQQYNVRLDFTPTELLAHYLKRAADCEAQALLPLIRQTTRDSHKAQAGAFLEQAKAVAKFYGLRKKVDEKTIERLAASKARAEKRERIAREKAEKAQRAEYETAFEDWKKGVRLANGQSAYFPTSLFPVAFRVEWPSGQDPELVSTLGARVPLQAARIAYRFAMSKRGQAWRENGNSPSGDETCQVGHYRLNAINEHGIVAGCHRIAWAELERLASVLA